VSGPNSISTRLQVVVRGNPYKTHIVEEAQAKTDKGDAHILGPFFAGRSLTAVHIGCREKQQRKEVMRARRSFPRQGTPFRGRWHYLLQSQHAPQTTDQGKIVVGGGVVIGTVVGGGVVCGGCVVCGGNVVCGGCVVCGGNVVCGGCVVWGEDVVCGGRVVPVLGPADCAIAGDGARNVPNTEPRIKAAAALLRNSRRFAGKYSPSSSSPFSSIMRRSASTRS
jgi:hypothetical protein